MSTLTSLVGSTPVTTAGAAAIINANFTALNNEKIETSYLDTDTTLAANSDTKIPTQKAVKAYVDVGGNVNATETTKGIVEEATDAEVTAGTATGGTGAKLFVTPAKLTTRLASYSFISAASGATTKNVADANGTQTIAHGLGKVPKMVKISAVLGLSATSGDTRISNTTSVYTGSTQSSIYSFIQNQDTAESSIFGSTFTITTENSGANGHVNVTGVITTDATNISIAWTKAGSPTGTANLIWEAIA